MMLRLQFNNRVALSSCNRPVSFLKNTSGCTAVVFTWYETHKTKPPHVQAGADERMITEYYDRYHNADPLRAELLIRSSSSFETLSDAKKAHDQYLLEEYQPFLHKYNIHEEMDLIFRAGGTVVASAALLQQENGRKLNSPYIRETCNYLQYTFSILPAVRLLNLNSDLELRYKLTPKERAVAELMLAGEPNKTIASQLDMELPTAKTHILHIFQKLQVTSRAKEAPINLPQPRSKLKIPLNLALLTAKYPVRATLASLSAHFSVLRA